MIKIGIIGLGYWGPNLLRNFDYSSDFEVIYVCDKNVNVLNKLRLNSKNKIKTDNISQILKDKSINAVAISTPVKSHYEIAKKALRAGKHVFIEKPLADSSYKCKKLIRLAKQ